MRPPPPYVRDLATGPVPVDLLAARVLFPAAVVVVVVVWIGLAEDVAVTAIVVGRLLQGRGQGQVVEVRLDQELGHDPGGGVLEGQGTGEESLLRLRR